MELPKNITQIGEADPFCKVYVEDYVFSYIKQKSGQAESREVAVALYGNKKEEGGVSYYFIYGAGEVHFLTKGTKHLSQAVLQDAEKLRKKYFPEYTFRGYQILNEEMPDGFYICEQGLCRLVEGYARFFEKNDAMLNFLLAETGQGKPENVPMEKYEMVKQRQEERRISSERGVFGKANAAFRAAEEPQVEDELPENGALAITANEKIIDVTPQPEEESKEGTPTAQRKGNILPVAVACAGLLAVGYMFAGENAPWKQLPVAAGIKQSFSNITEELSRKVLEGDSPQEENRKRAGTIIAEDKLTDAIAEENKQLATTSGNIQISTEAEKEETAVGEKETATEKNEIAVTGTEPQSGVATEKTEMASDNPEVVENIGEAETEQTSNGTGMESGGAENQDESLQQQETQTTAGENIIIEEEQNNMPEEAEEAAGADIVNSPGIYYIIMKGDTLNSICAGRYGSLQPLQEICRINEIKDPDDIKAGVKIFLP